MSYTLSMLNEMVKSRHCLFYINTDASALLASKLIDFQRLTGIESFRWQRGRGLSRCDLTGIYAPGSVSFTKALQYVSGSAYFGVFLFENVGNDIGLQDIEMYLKRLSSIRGESRRIVMVTGLNIKIPAKYHGYFREHHYQTLGTQQLNKAAIR